ncbi:branched-chain amino acid transport system substrate-binding protein [Herbaspirillum sp. Sphag1AN]|uniref:branched-chain amino acid ABC transporter substrate-binding protein n=1 Tax=unclassified Herbaspirillum TaxID=2624150 RepID=UPI00160A2563|nr:MULTISPECIES: branched-chain amino acid ABC transporter substrate-binding protein [unclassified Herbaspirillum]MBB3213145.1 branched-chain amino acid transport system substrate-binding protein [Herbaspirillum sp. Sphag1AN]MBB3246342.1 branched-chain amino acid transport system substrate-binding protein [Herbaspirillum sp. Sphag64]
MRCSFAAAMLALLVMLSLSSARAADRTVTIGYAAPLTGVSSGAAPSLVLAAELAIEDLNRQAIHLDGDRLIFKLLVQDDRSDPRTGELVAQYFAKTDVVAVIGHWNSGVSIAASKIYNAAGIAQLAIGSSALAYTTQGFGAAFRILPHDRQNASNTANYVVEQMKAKRIVVIHDQTLFGIEYVRQFNIAAGKLQGNIVGQYDFSSHTSDFNAALQGVKQSAPDAVLFAGLEAQAAQLVREMQRFQIKAPLVTVGGIVGSRFLQSAGAAGNGTVILEPCKLPHQGAAWLQFQKNFKERSGEEVGLKPPFSYDAVGLVAAAIRQANSLDRRALGVALHHLKFTGLTGRISFDADGNLENPVYTVFQVKDQKWVALKTIEGKN